MKLEEVKAMCYDMRRFERMAEEKRRREAKAKMDSIISEPEAIEVASEKKPKEDQTKTTK